MAGLLQWYFPNFLPDNFSRDYRLAAHLHRSNCDHVQCAPRGQSPVEHFTSDALEEVDALEEEPGELLLPVLGDHQSQSKALQDSLDGLNVGFGMLAGGVWAVQRDLGRP